MPIVCFHSRPGWVFPPVLVAVHNTHNLKEERFILAHVFSHGWLAPMLGGMVDGDRGGKAAQVRMDFRKQRGMGGLQEGDTFFKGPAPSEATPAKPHLLAAIHYRIQSLPRDPTYVCKRLLERCPAINHSVPSHCGLYVTGSQIHSLFTNQLGSFYSSGLTSQMFRGVINVWALPDWVGRSVLTEAGHEGNKHQLWIGFSVWIEMVFFCFFEHQNSRFPVLNVGATYTHCCTHTVGTCGFDQSCQKT